MCGVDHPRATFLHRGLRAALVVVMLAALASGVMWAHGRYASASATRVPIAMIVQDRARWLGRRVQVNGGLLRFSDPRSGVYGVVADGDFRIGVRHLDGWIALVGRPVIAVGTVEFDPHFGLYLARPTVHAAGRAGGLRKVGSRPRCT